MPWGTDCYYSSLQSKRVSSRSTRSLGYGKRAAVRLFLPCRVFYLCRSMSVSSKGTIPPDASLIPDDTVGRCRESQVPQSVPSERLVV